MIVKSIKHVSLENGKYCGVWVGYVLIIPMLDSDDRDVDFEIPTNQGTSGCVKVMATIYNNVATFEAK